MRKNCPQCGTSFIPPAVAGLSFCSKECIDADDVRRALDTRWIVKCTACGGDGFDRNMVDPCEACRGVGKFDISHFDP